MCSKYKVVKIYIHVIGKDDFQQLIVSRINNSNLLTIARANPYAISTSTRIRPIKCYKERHRNSFLPLGISMVNDILRVKPDCLTTMSKNMFKNMQYAMKKCNPVFRLEYKILALHLLIWLVWALVT